MTTENFGLIEYRGFKTIFIGLCKGKDDYYIIYGKTAMPSLSVEENTQDVYFHFSKVYSFTSSKDVMIQIPFINNKNSCATVINIKELLRKNSLMRLNNVAARHYLVIAQSVARLLKSWVRKAARSLM